MSSYIYNVLSIRLCEIINDKFNMGIQDDYFKEYFILNFINCLSMEISILSNEINDFINGINFKSLWDLNSFNYLLNNHNNKISWNDGLLDDIAEYLFSISNNIENMKDNGTIYNGNFNWIWLFVTLGEVILDSYNVISHFIGAITMNPLWIFSCILSIAGFYLDYYSLVYFWGRDVYDFYKLNPPEDIFSTTMDLIGINETSFIVDNPYKFDYGRGITYGIILPGVSLIVDGIVAAIPDPLDIISVGSLYFISYICLGLDLLSLIIGCMWFIIDMVQTIIYNTALAIFNLYVSSMPKLPNPNTDPMGGY
jgi:hypothetical protein